MKILGVSLGTKNGNNDTMCRVALEAARDAGAEIEFINLWDWDIRPCTGCVACSRALVMGKGMICSIQDDFKAFYDKMIVADGILFVDPIFECGASGYFHIISDRMGPAHDSGMLIGADIAMRERGLAGINPQYFKQKAVSFVGIGGSDWGSHVETEHYSLAMTPGWKVVDNLHFSWCKDIVMKDGKIARMQEVGRNLVEATAQIMEENKNGGPYPVAENENSYWKGKEGTCPHCHGNNFYVFPGTTHCVCEMCGLEGNLKIIDGSLKFVFDEDEVYKAHDVISGKKLHGDDILRNESRLIALGKDLEFRRRKMHYTAVCPSTPGPGKSKQK